MLSILTLVLLNRDMPCLCKQYRSRARSAEEANWSGSTLFVIKYVNLYQQSGSSNLIGWQKIRSGRGINSLCMAWVKLQLKMSHIVSFDIYTIQRHRSVYACTSLISLHVMLFRHPRIQCFFRGRGSQYSDQQTAQMGRLSRVFDGPHVQTYIFSNCSSSLFLTLVLLNKLRGHTHLIFSQLDYWNQIVDINSYTEWQIVQIQISWTLQKPTDLDLRCL